MAIRVRVDYEGHQNLRELLDPSKYAEDKHASLWVATPLIKTDARGRAVTLVAENLTEVNLTKKGFAASTDCAAFTQVHRRENPLISHTEVRLYGNGTLDWLDRRLDTLILPVGTERTTRLGVIPDGFAFSAGYIFRGDEAVRYLESLIALKALPKPGMRYEPVFT